MNVKIRFLCAVFVLATCQTSFAQALPAKVTSYLNKSYPGWKKSAIGGVADCYDEFKRPVIVGDFDGNGADDFVTRITHGRKGYFLAFLAINRGYKPHILLRLSASEMKDYGLGIAQKGDEYPIGDPYDGGTTGRLPNDAPLIGPCGSHSDPYIYRRGRFGFK